MTAKTAQSRDWFGYRPSWKCFAFRLAIAFSFCQLAANNRANAATYITQFGITWTFDHNYTTGQFANGDYWVVGPANIISIDPCSFVGDGVKTMAGQNHLADWTVAVGRTVNGSMINPIPNKVSEATNDAQGYDSAADYYSAGLNVATGVSTKNPLVLTAGT